MWITIISENMVIQQTTSESDRLKLWFKLHHYDLYDLKEIT